MIDRRMFLCAAAATSFVLSPRMALAHVESDRRFVFIIQRGAADGLGTVVPHGDPAYAGLRGALALEPAETIRLDGSFGLHPALAGAGRLFAAREALFVHAVASPYRDRSHFDGQNVLETGGASPYERRDGWLNRLAALLPKTAAEAIAFAPTVPLALRGAAAVTSYAASRLPEAPDDLLARVTRLYAADSELHPLWTAALEARGPETAGGRQSPAAAGSTAAHFLAREDGPRIAMIETGGWDTHVGQSARLATQLASLDALVDALREGLGPVWERTVVLVATEFGRTAAANGSGGTDHGTASAAMLLGGAVNGGRVLANWPGLSPAALYEGRDLAPTLDLDALIATVAAETFRLAPDRVMRALFPDRPRMPRLEGLVRA